MIDRPKRVLCPIPENRKDCKWLGQRGFKNSFSNKPASAWHRLGSLQKNNELTLSEEFSTFAQWFSWWERQIDRVSYEVFFDLEQPVPGKPIVGPENTFIVRKEISRLLTPRDRTHLPGVTPVGKRWRCQVRDPLGVMLSGYFDLEMDAHAFFIDVVKIRLATYIDEEECPRVKAALIKRLAYISETFDKEGCVKIL